MHVYVGLAHNAQADRRIDRRSTHRYVFVLSEHNRRLCEPRATYARILKGVYEVNLLMHTHMKLGSYDMACEKQRELCEHKGYG